jgi:uncharacterized repeat protein (TIGR01451 family)
MKGGQMGVIKKRLLLLCVLSYFCVVTSAIAEPLKSTLEAYIVKKDSHGKEIFEKTQNASPGEIVEYRLIYENTGTTVLSGLVVNGPIPDHTKFIGNSAKTDISHDFVVSIDHGKTWEKEPVKRVKKMSNGKQKTVVIPPEQYTNVKWLSNDPIKPKSIQQYIYRVKN